MQPYAGRRMRRHHGIRRAGGEMRNPTIATVGDSRPSRIRRGTKLSAANDAYREMNAPMLIDLGRLSTTISERVLKHITDGAEPERAKAVSERYRFLHLGACHVEHFSHATRRFVAAD